MEAQGPDVRAGSIGEAVAKAQVHAPTRGNRKLERFLEAVNSDERVRAWWYMAQITSERLGMSDHSWVHVQVVLNIALRLLRLLVKGGIEPAMVTDHGMRDRDAEVVVAGGALLHDVGMSIHRADHEAYSLFMVEERLQSLLAESYDEPERTVVIAEILHAIIGHRRRGEPYTVEAGVVRVADALDMAEGRSRLPVEGGQYGIHALSAAAIDEVRIEAGEERPVKIEIEMNNSAGVFQVDDLLATKLRGTPLEGHVEVIAQVKGEPRSACALVPAVARRHPAASKSRREGLDAGALAAAAFPGGEPGGALDADAADGPADLGLTREAILERQPEALQRRAPVGQHRLLRELGQALGHLEGALQVLAGRHHLRQQSHRQRLLGLDDATGEDQIEGAAHPDDARQPLGAAVDQRDAPAPLWESELRRLGPDPKVAPEGELQPAGQGVAGDRGEGRLR